MTDRFLPTLVFVATFLGLFAFVGSMIPTWVGQGLEDPRTADVPDYFPSDELVMFYETLTHNVTDEIYLDNDYTLGNRHFTIRIDLQDDQNYIVNCHFYYFLVFAHGFHSLEWMNDQGVVVSETKRAIVYGTWNMREVVTKDTVIANYDTTLNYAKFVQFCDHTKFTTFIYYNTTAYLSMEDAWDSHNFQVTQAIHFDQAGTSWNAWSLVSSLLFFQTPNIHPLINLVIALPFWVCIAYLIYRIILLAIPFVGGS